MMKMFFRFDPEHIIIQNYLQQLEKYIHSQLDVDQNQKNIAEEEKEFYLN